MYTFDEIIDNALTSREEVEMVSDAQIGAEHDIDRVAMEAVAQADMLAKYARFQANMINRNPGSNPFGMR